ncbi:precursor of CEP3-like [Juglans regia]|uniref:Precursor of CEP3-like n=1 Tax=Juglans regia TaxID=51240 RepID=A0A6P9EWT3_JUGRE|nr:precursor of CEP3-like [Juglans regia]
MAQNKILISACFFFVLIFSQETRFIEGRRLLVGKNNEFQTTLQTHNKIHDDHDMTTSDAITREAVVLLLSPPTALADEGVTPPPPPPAYAINDFRPTAPGHSPGAGHSIHH